MSDMKCPICQNNLHKINIIVSTCTNDKCKLWGSSIPNLVLDALAQAKQDLECTRKALEIAVDALKSAHDYYEHCAQTEYDGDDVNWDCTADTMDNDISEALEQITLLEQKE